MAFWTKEFGTGLIATAACAMVFAAAALAGPAPSAHADGGCDSTIDLVLVLDGSESINWAQFALVKTFAADVVGGLDIGPDEGHVGVVQFAGEGEGIIEVTLTGDLTTVQAGIVSMTQIVGVTDIQEGIELGQGQLTTNGRDGIPHVMVVLTDGAHNEPGDPVAEAEAARMLGTEIFAIAIGDGPKLDELNAIVSEPFVTHVFTVDNFAGLVAIIEPLVEVVCKPAPTATPPVEATTTNSGIPTPTAGGPNSGATATPDGGVLGVTELPSTGAGLPANWIERAAWLSLQAIAGLGSVVLLVAAAYVMTRRRAQS